MMEQQTKTAMELLRSETWYIREIWMWLIGGSHD